MQIAFREGGWLRVAVINALSGLDPAPLRAPRTDPGDEGDAQRGLRRPTPCAPLRLTPLTHPRHDAGGAPRRGETRCSLQAQAQTHLKVTLIKAEQRGDWTRRPLTREQLKYAALDAACTLLLYEDQTRRVLAGNYRPHDSTRQQQTLLPHGVAPHVAPAAESGPRAGASAASDNLRAQAVVLLGVLTELGGRYSPERLAASAGADRVGLMGWIIDRTLGREADLDEEIIRLEVAELCERGLVRLDESRRLEATEAGSRLWHQHR